MIKQLSPIILISVLCACTDISAPSHTVPVHTGHADITDSLIKQLKSNDDWYRSINATTIEVSNPPPNYVIAFLEVETNKFIPKNRSFSVSSDLRKLVYAQLSANNIDYQVAIFDGDEWVIWEEKDTEKVQNIIDSVAETALNGKLNN